MKRLSSIIQRIRRSSSQQSQESTPEGSSGANDDVLKLKIYSTKGKIIKLEVSKQIKGSELKVIALRAFYYKDGGNIPKNILDLCHLIYSKTRQKLDESKTLVTLNITGNDEFIITQRTTPIAETENLNGPKLQDVLEATKDLEPTKHTPPIVNIETLLLQNDLQFDIRKILISLSQASAYVIGAGPFAERLISMLKLRLLNRRKHEADTVQCLVDMGFTKDRAKYALRIKNNVYAAALEWLIENQSSLSLDTLTSPEISSTSNRINYKNNPCENIESLLEIIRIHAHRNIPPTKDMIKGLVDMGFLEDNVVEALKVTRNNQAAACEWLCGIRSQSLLELRDGLPRDSPVLKALLASPQVQISLSNPKMFLAYISMLENYSSMTMWLGDNDTSGVLGHILRTYHEEKHIIAINQFSSL